MTVRLRRATLGTPGPSSSKREAARAGDVSSRRRREETSSRRWDRDSKFLARI